MLKLIKPFYGKADFPITQNFGENPSVYQRFGLPGHNGIDFGCPKGSEICACADGIVVLSEKHKAYGNIIKIKHKNGYFTLYAHLSKNFVVVKEKVKKGEIIGLSGSTGFSTGPHLHFGLQSATKGQKAYNYYIDPRPQMTGKLIGALSAEEKYEKEEKAKVLTVTKTKSRTKKSKPRTTVSFKRISKAKTSTIEKKYVFNKNLNYGDKNKEIIELQKRLKDEGFFNYRSFTQFYGPVTRQAVLNYQIAKGIVFSPYDVGAGRVGPATRATLNK